MQMSYFLKDITWTSGQNIHLEYWYLTSLSAELRMSNHTGLALCGTAKHSGLPQGLGKQLMVVLELLQLL